MSELTKSQDKAIDGLIENFGPGEVTAKNEDGSVHFDVARTTYVVGPRGAINELAADRSATQETPVAEEPGTPGRADAVGPGSQTSSAGQPVEGGPALDEPSVSPEPSNGEDGPNPVEADQQENEAAACQGAAASPEQVAPVSADVPPEGAGALAHIPGPDQLPQVLRSDAYEAISAADERQAVQEIEGNAPKAAVYSFSQGGQKVVGLSAKGVREIVRIFNTRGLGQIEIDGEPLIERVKLRAEIGEKGNKKVYGDVPGVEVTVCAVDRRNGGRQFATAQATRDQVNKKVRDEDGLYEWKPDTFATAKALSKAQRNALETLTPLELQEQLKAMFVGQGQVEYIPGTGREAVKDLPPALTDDRAVEQAAKCRALYSEWGKLGGKKTMTPAQFSNSLIAVQHSHERLDDLIAHLGSKLAEAQGGSDA